MLPGREIFVSQSTDETLGILKDLPEAERAAVACRARARVLASHTSEVRAQELERYARIV